jgi:hypothetical protein
MSVVLRGTPIYEITFKEHATAEEETVIATGERERDEMIRLIQRAHRVYVSDKILWTYGEGVPV